MVNQLYNRRVSQDNAVRDVSVEGSVEILSNKWEVESHL